jgi:MFS family permease
LISTFEAIFSTGLVLGSVKISEIISRIMGRFRTVIFGYFCTGLSVLVMGISTTYSHENLVLLVMSCMPFLLLGGVGLTLVTVNITTVRSLASPHNTRNQINSTTAFISGCAIPLSSACSGIISTNAGATSTLVIFGIAAILCATLGLTSSEVRKVLSLSRADLVGAYERLYGVGSLK